jgi:hypothetical protein
MSTVKATKSTQVPPKAPPIPQAKADQVAHLKAVYGYMVHPFTNETFNIDRVTAAMLDSWVQAQIDAGKLTHVNS